MSIDNIVGQLVVGTYLYIDKDGYVTHNPGTSSDPNQYIGIITSVDTKQNMNMIGVSSLDGTSNLIPGMVSGITVNQIILLNPSQGLYKSPSYGASNMSSMSSISASSVSSMPYSTM